MNAYHLNGIFAGFFLEKWNCTLFSTKETKCIELYRDWKFQMLVPMIGRGLRTYQPQEICQLNFLWYWTFYRTTNKITFFGEEDGNFICLAAAASTFRQENQPLVFTVFFLDVTQKRTGSPNYASKRKHKYRPQNLIRFRLKGYSCVLKRPPTLPTGKDSRWKFLEICRHL